MKIGILTFHSQLNYGALLQCWALSKVLAKLGHQPIVLDKWEHEWDNLAGPFKGSVIKVMKAFVRVVLGMLPIGIGCRYKRTRTFLRQIGLSKFHFKSWQALQHSLGVDCVIAGSDQIWTCSQWGDLSTYMLEGAPKIPFISYAASFGMREIPSQFKDQYREGLPRYLARSVREDEGRKLVESLGLEATTVVDPTILLDPEIWYQFVPKKEGARKQNFILVYMIGADQIELLRTLSKIVETYGVKFVVVTPGEVHGSVLALYKSHRGVELIASAGPKEFVELISEARGVITDSFHATAISSIYGVNCKVVRPDSEFRRAMFSRLEEFVTKYSNGGAVVDDVESAAKAITGGNATVWNAENASIDRARSKEWLIGALSKAMQAVNGG